MTVICYRDGIMAADSQVFKGALRYGNYVKIKRLPDGALFGAAGLGEDCQAVYAWLRDGGEKPKVEEGFQGIIARPGREFPFEIEQSLCEREMPGNFAVVGENTAVSVCIGAMSMGASAELAVRSAIENTVWVGGPIQVERL